jgi:hypothetical protein
MKQNERKERMKQNERMKNISESMIECLAVFIRK